MCLCCLPNTEAPEEEYDGRSLFERLQEQKDKKQEEYDEQFKFSKGPALIYFSSSPLSLQQPLPHSGTSHWISQIKLLHLWNG